MGEVETGIHPNPVGDVLNIHSRKAIESVFVTDISGRLVWKHTNLGKDEETKAINTSSWPKGAYIVRIKAGGKETAHKVIKK